MHPLCNAAALAVAIAALSAPAIAHVTLATGEAAPDSTYKAVLQVGHGCSGKATTAIRVRIPEGVIVAKPMPKSGWQLATKSAAYGKAYDYYGTSLTEGVTEISWSGGELPDAYYDEFAFRVRLTNVPVGQIVYFPVVQECGEAVHRWIEIPKAGESADDYEEPAPGVTIVPPQR